MTPAQQFWEEGKLEGKLEAAQTIAKRLISANTDLSFIAQITQLSFEKVKMLKEQTDHSLV